MLSPPPPIQSPEGQRCQWVQLEVMISTAGDVSTCGASQPPPSRRDRDTKTPQVGRGAQHHLLLADPHVPTPVH